MTPVSFRRGMLRGFYTFAILAQPHRKSQPKNKLISVGFYFIKTEKQGFLTEVLKKF